MIAKEISFDSMPQALAYLIGMVESLEQILHEKNERQSPPVDLWLNIDELKEFLPDKPARATIYGWVSTRQIPFHKRGKKLYFLKSEIDSWLSEGKKRCETDLISEAERYLEKKKGVAG